jgi:hypothetical protein
MQDENRSDGNGRVPVLTCSGCGLRYSSGAIARHPALAAAARCRRCGGALERGGARVRSRAVELLKARRRRLERALAAGEDDPVAVAGLVLAVASAEEVTRELGARRQSSAHP